MYLREFSGQVENLVRLSYPDRLNLTAPEFRKILEPLYSGLTAKPERALDVESGIKH